MAETYASQAADDLAYHALYRLRAIAAREAGALLAEISGWLGVRTGLDDRGETRWSGLIADFQAGYATVRATLDLIRADAERVEDALHRPETGVFLVVRGAGVGEIRIDPAQRLEWAREAFRSYGGTRRMFTELRSPEGQLAVLAPAARHRLDQARAMGGAHPARARRPARAQGAGAQRVPRPSSRRWSSAPCPGYRRASTPSSPPAPSTWRCWRWTGRASSRRSSGPTSARSCPQPWGWRRRATPRAACPGAPPSTSSWRAYRWTC